jgi:hypothetical protein
MDDETAPQGLHDLLDQAWQETNAIHREFRMWARSGYFVVEFEDNEGDHHIGVPQPGWHKLKPDRSFRPRRKPWEKVERDG